MGVSTDPNQPWAIPRDPEKLVGIMAAMNRVYVGKAITDAERSAIQEMSLICQRRFHGCEKYTRRWHDYMVLMRHIFNDPVWQRCWSGVNPQ